MTTPESISVEPITDHPWVEFQVAHMLGRNTLQNGQAAPSLHRPIARLVVDPELLQAATEQMKQLDEQEAFVDMANTFQLQRDSVFRLRTAALLRNLVYEADTLFREVVKADASDSAGPILATVTTGPYAPRAMDARWHRDFACSPRKDLGVVVYNLDLVGQATTLSTGTHSEGDFYDNKLEEAPAPTEQYRYEPGTIVAIDGTLGVYRTSGEEYKGQPWLNFRSWVTGGITLV